MFMAYFKVFLHYKLLLPSAGTRLDAFWKTSGQLLRMCPGLSLLALETLETTVASHLRNKQRPSTSTPVKRGRPTSTAVVVDPVIPRLHYECYSQSDFTKMGFPAATQLSDIQTRDVPLARANFYRELTSGELQGLSKACHVLGIGLHPELKIPLESVSKTVCRKLVDIACLIRDPQSIFDACKNRRRKMYKILSEQRVIGDADVWLSDSILRTATHMVQSTRPTRYLDGFIFERPHLKE